jgi:hypothetical protein
MREFLADDLRMKQRLYCGAKILFSGARGGF